MGNNREQLARDIHRAGTCDPDSLAAFLIREGWGRKADAFTAGVVSTVDAVNAISAQPAMLRPMMRSQR